MSENENDDDIPLNVEVRFISADGYHYQPKFGRLHVGTVMQGTSAVNGGPLFQAEMTDAGLIITVYSFR